MERNWLDFKSLYSLEGARSAFEKACERLLREMYKPDNVQQVSLSQGDGGIDIFIGNVGINPIQVYQCKFFLEKIGSSQKQQIKESFITAISNNKIKMSFWTLCIPRVFTSEEHSWWEKWKAAMELEYKIPKETIRLFNGNQLIDEMQKFGIYNQVFQLEDSLRLLNIEKILNQLIITQEASDLSNGSINTKLKNIITKSSIYQDYKARINEKRNQLEKVELDDKRALLDIRKGISETETELNEFVRNMVALDKWFQSMEIDSERLKNAKRFFENSEFKEAAACLNQKELDDEAAILMAQKKILDDEKGKMNEKLKHLADEYLLKAALFSVDYMNRNYVIQTEEVIEKALSVFEDLSILINAAKFYNRIGNNRRGVDCLEKGALYINNDPTNEILYCYNLGTIYIRIDNEKAEYYLEKTIECCSKDLNPDSFIFTILANALHNQSILYEKTDINKHINLLIRSVNARIDAAKINPLLYSNAAFTLNRLSTAYYMCGNYEELIHTFEQSLMCMELFIKHKPEEKSYWFQEECLNILVFTPHYIKYLGHSEVAFSYKDRLLALLDPFALYVSQYDKESVFAVARAYEAYIRFYGEGHLHEKELHQMLAKMIYYYKESMCYRIPDDTLFEGLAFGSFSLSIYMVQDLTTKKIGYKMALEALGYFENIVKINDQFREWKDDAIAFVEKLNECQCDECVEMRK